MTYNLTLEKVLEAREKRGKIRIQYARNTISLTLNIPGFPKSNSLIQFFFEQTVVDLVDFLRSYNILLEINNSQNFIDDAGNFFIAPFYNNFLNIFEIKKICEEFEQKHKIGRIIDIDVFDENGKPISSNTLKNCLICESKPAIHCIREQKHSFTELRETVFSKIEAFLYDKKAKSFIRNISVNATKSLLCELSISPKPGLVDFQNSGSHKDMNYVTFINSISSLSIIWQQFSEEGLKYSGNLSDVLPLIRQIGLKAEKLMFSETNNVNTHKGIIFLLGLSCFSTAYCYKIKKEINYNFISEIIKKICKNIVENELENSKLNPKTHGEIVYKRYGKIAGGARSEAQSGFSLIFIKILPVIENEITDEILLNQNKFNQILQKILSLIISLNNDTNILYRTDIEILNQTKKLAEKAFNENEKYVDLCNFCKEKNISAGGSADILAVSLFFFFIKKNNNYEF